MRSIAAIGTVFRSAESPTCGPLGRRRPSSSTSVRAEPRPRRSMPANDWAELPDCGRKLPADENVLERMNSATLTAPLASSSSRLITVTGSAPSASARLMREPVISTVWVCAKVGSEVTRTVPPIAVRTAVQILLLLNMDSPVQRTRWQL